MTQDNNDFARLFEAGLDSLKTTIRTGEKVKGKVAMIGKTPSSSTSAHEQTA